MNSQLDAFRTSLTPLIVRMLLYFEIFFINILLLFWIIVKADRILIESVFDLGGILGSGMMFLYIAHLWSNNNKKNHDHLLSIQWILNLITVSMALGILVLLQYNNWLYYNIPYSWTFCVWILFNGFALVCVFGFEINSPSFIELITKKNMKIAFLLILSVLILVGYWIISTSMFLSSLIIYIMITHATLSISIKIKKKNNTSIQPNNTTKDGCSANEDESNKEENIKDGENKKVIENLKDIEDIENNENNENIYSSKHSKFAQILFHKEPINLHFSKGAYHAITIFANLLILLSLFFWKFSTNDTRSLEASWDTLLSFIFSWGTLIGMILCFLLVYLMVKKTPSISILGVSIILLLSLSGTMGIFSLASIFFGFGIFLNFFLQLSYHPKSYGLYGWGIQLMGLFSLLGINFYGIFQDMQKDIVNILLGLLFCSGILFLIFFRFSKKKLMQKEGKGFSFIKTWKIKHLTNKDQKNKNDSSANNKSLKSTWKRLQKNTIFIIIVMILLGVVPFISIKTINQSPIYTNPMESKELNNYTGITHIQFTEENSDEYESVHRIGSKWTRIDLSWDKIEPSPGVWKWDKYDDIITTLDNQSMLINALFSFDNDAVQIYNNDTNLRYIHPLDVPLFLDYVNHTIRKYYLSVDSWEIWNEPNIERFWGGSEEDFYYLIEQTLLFIHQIEEDMGIDLTIIAPSATGGVMGYVPVEFEEYFRRGFDQYFDAVNIHVYQYNAESLKQSIMNFQIILQKYHYSGELWITEIGYPSGGEYPWQVSNQVLADNILKNLVISVATGIDRFIWYTYRDSNSSVWSSEALFGLLYDNSTWKTGAFALSLFNNYSDNSVYRPDLIDLQGSGLKNDYILSVFQKEEGFVSIIAWFDPLLPREKGHLSIDPSQISGDVLIHDIYTGQSKTIDPNLVEIDTHPILLTFQLKDSNVPIRITAEDTWLEQAILPIFGIGLIGIMSIKIKQKKDGN